MTVNATMPEGAVVNFETHASDNVGVASFSCSWTSGSVFPVGKTTVSCSATDAAGNPATASFDVTVLGANEQIANLIARVSGMNLNSGVAQPIIAQLETAYRSPGSNDPHVSCIKMSDVIDKLSAASASEIAPVVQHEMIEDARRIMVVLGC
jgi:hypothetical protein